MLKEVTIMTSLRIIWSIYVGAAVSSAFIVSTKRIEHGSFFRKMSSVSTSNSIENPYSSTQKYDGSKNTSPIQDTTMLPLSEEPLLLVSSNPLLTPEECKIVIQYLEMTKDGSVDPLNDVFFEENGNYVFSTAHESKVNADASTMNNNDGDESNNDNDALFERARNIIYRVRSDIDRLTNSKSHSGDFALPRFLSFKVEQIPDPSKDGVKQTLHTLLPDGLHSDNVNDMFTRHISALLYLSDEVDECDEVNGLVGGSTTFPLALPLGQDSNEKTTFDKRVEEASMKLIQSNILHTGQRNFENGEMECTLLESAAYSVFYRDIMKKGGNSNNNQSSIDLPPSTLGIRVNPKPGQLCMFHNLLDNGSPDPLSFHAGEAILGRSSSASTSGKKVLLVFFKTIPLNDSMDHDKKELALKSKASRDWIKQQYY